MALSSKGLNIYFPLKLSSSQTHHSTHTNFRIFTMSSLDDQFLLMWALIDANQEFADEKMNKFR